MSMLHHGSPPLSLLKMNTEPSSPPHTTLCDPGHRASVGQKQARIVALLFATSNTFSVSSFAVLNGAPHLSLHIFSLLFSALITTIASEEPPPIAAVVMLVIGLSATVSLVIFFICSLGEVGYL